MCNMFNIIINDGDVHWFIKDQGLGLVLGLSTGQTEI